MRLQIVYSGSSSNRNGRLFIHNYRDNPGAAFQRFDSSLRYSIFFVNNPFHGTKTPTDLWTGLMLPKKLWINLEINWFLLRQKMTLIMASTCFISFKCEIFELLNILILFARDFASHQLEFIIWSVRLFYWRKFENKFAKIAVHNYFRWNSCVTIKRIKYKKELLARNVECSEISYGNVKFRIVL